MGGKLPTLQAPRFVIVNYLVGTVFMGGGDENANVLCSKK